MVVQNDPAVNLETFMLPAEFQRAHQSVATGRRGENREPLDNCSCDEVSVIAFMDAIAAAHGRRLTKRSFQDKCVPKLELGNEIECSCRPAGDQIRRVSQRA